MAESLPTEEKNPNQPVRVVASPVAAPTHPSAPRGKKVAIGARLFSMLFLAIFVLGVSMMIGEGSTAAHLPYSATSITTTVFGLLGFAMSEVTAKRAERWQ